jgi:hypothetical protein
MFDKLSILLHEECTKYTFGEWEEVPNLLEIVYLEDSLGDMDFVQKINLPVFSKEDWEEFKRAGDMAFKMMEYHNGM